jgi:hypothetical protein
MGAARIIGVLAMITVTVLGTTRWRGAEPPSDWRTRFTQAALQIPFEEDRPPERDTLLPRDAKIPEAFLRFRIAAARTRDSSQAGGIGFRVTSDTAYPRLGIAQGVNYVWKDVVNGKTRLLIIPADTAKPAHWLAVSSHSHPSRKITSRLVLGVDVRTAMGRQPVLALGRQPVLALVRFCGECKDKPMTWCGAQDTVSVAEFRSAPVAGITRYFARNHVAFLQR